MHFKLGDLVIRKDENMSFVFKISGFDGKYAILKGTKIPIMTIVKTDKLIKLNRNRVKNNVSLKCIK
ncbi:MAG: hypothetical protein ACQEQF_06805 [Bacillota bacterium]